MGGKTERDLAMRVFLTGATGFIGAHILPELLAAGHAVIGLTRSEAGAARLAALGAEPHLGSLEAPDSLRRGVARAEAVIHCAFDHEFSGYVENCAKDGRAIAAMGAELAGSDRPIVITSVTGLGDAGDGQPAREAVFDRAHPNPRAASELAGAELLEAGINLSVVRLPQVHDTTRQGLITPLIALARAKGVSAYLGEGRNRWSAGHVSDVARLYRLALERRAPGARYHAVDEAGIPLREIAETIGQGLGVPAVSLDPAEAAAHFDWLARFVGLNLVASSAWTRAELGWQPGGPGLLADLRAMDYGAA